MQKINPISILRKHGRRATDQRVALLSFLIENPKAHALSEIEGHFSNEIDRVTIYRSLNAFIKMGVIMKFINSRGTPFFIFREKSKEISVPHPHMRCINCGKIICLPELPRDYLRSIARYKIDLTQFYSEGTCLNCLSDH